MTGDERPERSEEQPREQWLKTARRLIAQKAAPGDATTRRSRLRLVDPDLATTLEQLSPAEQRRAVLEGARRAVERTGLDDARIRSALNAASTAPTRSNPHRDLAREVSDELDLRAGPLREAETWDEYRLYFRRARAASAVMLVFEDDSVTSVLDCWYEAGAAIGNLEPLSDLLAAS